MKKIFKIFDSEFAHVQYCTLNNLSKNIIWDRSGNIDDGDYVFFTDKCLPMVDNIKKNCKKFAWLIEPKIIQDNSKYIIENYQKFDMIFTHEIELLKISDRFKLTPQWCSWILPENQIIGTKTKNLSIIASPKKFTDGHKFRHEVIDSLSSIFEIDKYGKDYQYLEEKSSALSEYRFSIIIENSKSSYYFTEKLIDCLICGTVPIYWGCEKVSEFFDTRGFFIVDNLQDIIDILPKLTEKTYEEMLPFIRYNYNISKNYCTIEDFIYENYLIDL